MSHPVGGVDVVTAPTWTLAWTIDPLVVSVLLASATLYTLGAVRIWRRAGIAHGVRPHHALAHGLGLLVIAIALLSPLDGASDALFAAHMAQHELLMLIAAPLIVIGRPIAPVVSALPRALRAQARAAARSRPIAVGWRLLTLPFVALVLHAAVRWAWHVPAAFDGALENETIHAVQHLSFFATALLFWWTLLHGRYARLGYGVGVAYVFFTLLHSGLLAAVISFADAPLYAHGERAARIGFDAIADQQRAGLVMWVPAGIIMMAIGLAILAAWLGHSARRIAQSSHPSLR